MKIAMKPNIMRAGVILGVIGVVLSVLANFVPLLSCILSPLGFLIPIAAGVYAVMLGFQAGSPTGVVAQDAVDGGLAGALSGLLTAVVSALFILLGLGASAVSSRDATGSIVAGGLGVVAGVSTLCFGVIFGLILGAVGGAVYGLIKQNQSGASAGTPRM